MSRKNANKNAKYPQLDPDAPPVPRGMRPRPGVEFGCGQPDCRDCYEPAPVAKYGSIDNPAV